MKPNTLISLAFIKQITCLFFLLCIIRCGTPYIDHLAGSPLTANPYFHHHQVFVEGENLYVALDPNKYPSKIGSTFQVYVVAHKDQATWATNPNLIDVSGTVETAVLTGTDLSTNQILAWSNIPTTDILLAPWFKQYDVVFDFNGNGKYDESTDIIDLIGTLEMANGLAAGGFTLIKDPIEFGSFSFGTREYNLGSFEGDVPCDCGLELISTIRGRIYYPTNVGGKIPTGQRFPVVVIAHGNSGNYQGFNYLGNFLASRGFVCASVDAGNVLGDDIYLRGQIILRNIQMLTNPSISDPFIASNIQPIMDIQNIGLVGHSRGGESILVAEELFNKLLSPPNFSLKAICMLAPHDVSQIGGTGNIEENPCDPFPTICGPYQTALPSLLMYGTLDGDMEFGQGYRILDRNARHKFGITLYGGNHENFDEGFSSPSPLTHTAQRRLTRAFVLPFLNIFLKEEQFYMPIFSGHTIPPSFSNATNEPVLYNFQPRGYYNVRLPIDDFETAPINQNSLGFPNNNSSILCTLEEVASYRPCELENYYTNQTTGLRVAWDYGGASPNGSIEFDLNEQNALFYEHLNFRVAQRFRCLDSFHCFHIPNCCSSGCFAATCCGAGCCAYNLNVDRSTSDLMEQDMSIVLKDVHGNISDPVLISTFSTTKIPSPDNRATYPKSIFQTVTIPLSAFTSNGSSVDLAKLKSLHFLFDQTPHGELIFDDIELLGLDISEPDPRPTIPEDGKLAARKK